MVQGRIEDGTDTQRPLDVWPTHKRRGVTLFHPVRAHHRNLELLDASSGEGGVTLLLLAHSLHLVEESVDRSVSAALAAAAIRTGLLVAADDLAVLDLAIGHAAHAADHTQDVIRVFVLVPTRRVVAASKCRLHLRLALEAAALRSGDGLAALGLALAADLGVDELGGLDERGRHRRAAHLDWRWRGGCQVSRGGGSSEARR